MSTVLQRGSAVVAVIAVSLLLATTGLAQLPGSPWKKGAPFPEADEELYGVAVEGKLYVISGFGGGKGRGVNYEYDPATDKWTKKKSMPRPAHHPALASYNGKIYVLGGFVAPEKPALPIGAEWEPIDNAWEYDPSGDSWKELAPLPGKRGSAVAAEVGGKIHVIGGVTTVEGAKSPAISPMGQSRDLTTNDVYDPATNKWESRKPMGLGRNHAFAAAVNGKIYVIGGRTGHGFITKATNTDVVEEYNPATDTWSAPKERMPTPRSGGGCGTDGRRIYVAGGEVTTKQLIGAYRAVEAYDPATDSWSTLPPMPMPRHGVAGAVVGNRFHLVSGMITSAGALVMQDPHLETHTAMHDILELPGAPAEAKTTSTSISKPVPYVRYDVKSPQGKKMLAKLARAIHIMKQYPDHDPQSYAFWCNTHWLDGPSAHEYEESMKHKAEVIAQLPPASQALADAIWNSCQSHTQDPADPDHYRNDLFLPWHRLYLYHFEQTVREVLKDDDFSIPYWNAASEDVADQSLPGEFREKGSPLYNPTRYPWVQEGESVKYLFGNWFNLNALNETFYIDKLNGNLGFCPQVDINPHSLVHMSIGGDMALGFVRVVEDPIFWPHHANIDRVWESWNQLGHKNPTDPKWLDRKFTFVDRNGERVDVSVSAVNRIVQLGYEYDNLAQTPTPGPAPTAETSVANRDTDAKAGQSLPAPASNLPDDRVVAEFVGKSQHERKESLQDAYRVFAESVAKSQPSQAPAWSLPDASGQTVSLAQFEGRSVVVIFYRGYGCLLCMAQLNNLAEKAREFADAGIDVVAISTDSPDSLRDQVASYKDDGGFPILLLSNAKLDIFDAYGCIDSDGKPLHGTFLVNAQGLIRWRNIGVQPFDDPAFVLKEGRKLFSLASAR